MKTALPLLDTTPVQLPATLVVDLIGPVATYEEAWKLAATEHPGGAPTQASISALANPHPELDTSAQDPHLGHPNPTHIIQPAHILRHRAPRPMLQTEGAPPSQHRHPPTEGNRPASTPDTTHLSATGNL